MKQIIILALLLILVLGDQHQNKHNHYKHKKGHVFKWVLISIFAVGAFLIIRKIVRRRRHLKRMKKQGLNKLSETVVFGEPMNDNIQQPQYYAVPIEQYKQFKNWLNQQKQQQEALLQQQQQIQQQLLLQQQQQQQSAQINQIPQQPIAGYPIYQQYPQQVPQIVYPQILNKSHVEIQLPEVRVPQ
ncbi:unnamed protein product [Paramecium pentaurelia]|uniref:Uncharacterized protein n=1 Tax=Paramecium pentaurelia TaxID=43138 RepID=A0A8S1X9W7_9CILI|nr:unnamed protein product [Paramecium pentaurelia]